MKNVYAIKDMDRFILRVYSTQKLAREAVKSMEAKCPYFDEAELDDSWCCYSIVEYDVLDKIESGE